jgi:RluA family pseudouridine synthase
VREPIKLSSGPTGEFWELPDLYEDEQFLALEKPSGLLTSPDRDDLQRPNLMKLLHAGIAEQKPWAKSRQLNYLANAHRLENETSGVMLLAKSKEALIYLANLFSSERISQKYVALSQGNPENDSFEVDAPIGPHSRIPDLMRIDRRRGKKSRTRFVVLEKFRGWTLLRCEPFTSRLHQIQTHLRSAHLPIVGDTLYGGKPLLLSRLKPGYYRKSGEAEHPLINRVALHAEEMSFAHPSNGQIIRICSPLPKELKVGLKYLRRYAAA